MTRVSKIIQLVMWSLVALLLTAFLCREISGGASRFGWNWQVHVSNPQTVDYTGTFPLDSVKKVEIQGLSIDVDFTVSDSDEIHVTGRTGGAAGNVTVDVVNSNGVLQITQKAGGSAARLFGIFNTGYQLQVALPSAYAGDIWLGSISGDVTGDVAANAITCRLTSGDIRLGQLAVHSYALETVSGDIICAGVTGAGSLSSVSGDIQADIAALSGASSAASRSGDIHLQLAPSVQARVAAHSVSGDVSSDIPLPGSDAPALEASSTSGDVTVRRSR